MHQNEPKMSELQRLYRDLMTAESTPENVKKLQALTLQMARHEKAEAVATLTAPV